MKTGKGLGSERIRDAAVISIRTDIINGTWRDGQLCDLSLE